MACKSLRDHLDLPSFIQKEKLRPREGNDLPKATWKESARTAPKLRSLEVIMSITISIIL